MGCHPSNKIKRERERVRFFAPAFRTLKPRCRSPLAGRAPHARLPPSEHPPIRPSRTSPATKNPHPRAINQLPHFFYATQTPAHLQQQQARSPLLVQVLGQFGLDYRARPQNCKESSGNLCQGDTAQSTGDIALDDRRRPRSADRSATTARPITPRKHSKPRKAATTIAPTRRHSGNVAKARSGGDCRSWCAGHTKEALAPKRCTFSGCTTCDACAKPTTK